MKIVVINSIGPMASTVVGSVVEKFGYLNIPVRKLGLHEYLRGKRSLDDGYMKKRLIEHLDSHSTILTIGGVSVSDRDSSKPRQLVQRSDVEPAIWNYQNNSFSRVSNMYSEGRNIYAQALKYKKSSHQIDRHIEYTTDIHQHPPLELWQSYKSEFGDVYMINLHRDFSGWLDSLVSQRFAHPSFRTRCFFAFHSAFDLYSSYEKTMKEMPGLHLDFQELFIPRQDQLVNRISVFLGEPVPSIDWETEKYDLFGKLSDYKKTFTMADDKPKYLSPLTHGLIRKFIKSGRITIIHDAIIYLFYLLDYTCYALRKA